MSGLYQALQMIESKTELTEEIHPSVNGDSKSTASPILTAESADPGRRKGERAREEDKQV